MFTTESLTEDNFDADLVAAIGPRLQNAHYTDAILAGIKHLSEKLREVSGTEGDGAQLVGQALGGNAPQFRLNSLQTNSEKDEQKGIEQLLRGLYIGIRNPRTHEVMEDTEDFAIRVLVLVDIALKYLQREAEEFDVEALVNRIYEPHFVPSTEYAQSLMADVPTTHLVPVFDEAFRRREEGKAEKIRYAFLALYQLMSEDQQAQAVQTAGVALREEVEPARIAEIFRLLKPERWPMLQDDVRIRMENLIIDECRQGTYDIYRSLANHGLGSWGNHFGRYFDRKGELAEVLVQKLTPNWYTQNYVGKFYMSVLPVIITGELVTEAAHGLAYAAVSNNAIEVRNQLLKVAPNYPEAWRDALRVATQEHTESDPEYVEKLLKSLGEA